MISQKSSPFFSIIIPTLNEENFLPNLLQDISGQTFTDYDITVVDAKSQDRTGKIAQKAQAKIITSNKKNVAHQRNLGAKSAEGKYLLFMDADTQIPKHFLEGIRYRLTSSPSQVFTTWVAQDGNNNADKPVVALMNILLETAKIARHHAAFGAMIGCSKKIIENITFDDQIKYAEDGKFVRGAIKKGYTFKLYRDPRYIFSLRRFRQEGTLPQLQKYASLYLNKFTKDYHTNSKYPMLGGSAYTGKKQSSMLIKSFEVILSNAKGSRNKLRSFIDSILSS